MSVQTLKVGDKVIEGFYVAYVKRLFGNSATTSLDKKGEYILSKRVDQSYLRLATEYRLAVIAEYEREDKEFMALYREHNRKLASMRARLE